ncbi:Major facilitator superfamily domain general substrate transporter [Penicillium angulare]|uniref:Major facilitator superfamily domain general substrate transporter n=1 Tax=Penicillium angulare TaxID=116970 RepID=A0A9W9FUB3_9EURO|nr:Major facilitator superfamily domain general substrate transporter [Penicillium angulare]
MTEIRHMDNHTHDVEYIGSLDRGPVLDHSLSTSLDKALINTYRKRAPKRHIIVRNGSIAAIIDWELSGWYPEYWEFAKAFLI